MNPSPLCRCDHARADHRVRVELGDGQYKLLRRLGPCLYLEVRGRKTAAHCSRYQEKAETKAIGRALAALGYGTQFCSDFDEGGSVTDAPVQRQPRAAPTSSGTAEKAMPLKFNGLCTDCGWTIKAGVTALYNSSTKTVRHLTGECRAPGDQPLPAHTDSEPEYTGA